MTPALCTDRSWALFPHGLLVFERATLAGPSRMLISRLESCSAPECTCREVGLRGVTLDVGDDFTPDALVSEALRARMDGFVEFLSWFIRAGFAVPSTDGPNVLTLRLTAYGRRFLEIEGDHPLLLGFVERLVPRCPNLPDNVAALLVDARVCLDHMLMRPAIVLMGVGFEMVIERIFDSLMQRTIIPASQANARAAARIAAVRNAVDSALTPPPGQSVSPQLIDNRNAARHACDFADALRRRRNDASHTAPTYGFEDRQEAEDLIVSAASHLPNLWRLA